MSKSLGIKIEIDYSDIDKLQKALSQKVEDIDIDLNTSKANTKYTELARKLTSLKSTLSDTLKVNLNAESALNQLEELQTSYNTLKKSLESGLDLKLNLDKNMADTFGKIAEEASKTKKQTEDTVGRLGENLGEANGVYGKVSEATKSAASNSTKAVKEMSGELKEATGEADNMVASIDKLSNLSVGAQMTTLREIIRLMKEIDTLEGKRSDTNSDKVNAALEERIRLTKQVLDTTKEMYEGEHGSLKGEGVYEIQKAQVALNQAVRESSQEKEAQLQLDKQAAEQLREFVKLENERSKLIQQADKAESSGKNNEADLLRERAEALRSSADSIQRNITLESEYGNTVRETMNALMVSNNVQESFNNQNLAAKQADKANLEAQKANYKELTEAMKEAHRIRLQISELEAKESADVATGKESLKLDSLRQELALTEDIITKKQEAAVAEGKMSDAQRESIAALEKTQAAKEASAADTAKIAAEAQKVSQEYDKWSESIKKVGQLSEQLGSAGDKEAEKIREMIAAEKEYQKTIESTIDAMNGRNEVRHKEMTTQAKMTEQTTQDNEELRALRATDKYNEQLSTSGMLGNFFNPRTIYNEGKQAAMAVYRSVKEIDDAIVQIAKVVDAPQVELDRFAETVYDTASTVGRSAADYAVSVERWASSGKTLQESIELSKLSSMGSFVGNVDEAAMVDYMSVPLLAYEKAGLQATDVINAMNEVANNNAIEMNDLGEAYAKAAGTAANAGTTFSQLTGMISAAQETTRQGGQAIGNAFKSIDLNFVKMASQVTKDDKRKLSFFQDLGVDVLDANGQLNSTYDILKQLSGVWGDLDDATRGEAVLNFAGKHHSNIATSMLENWGLVEKAATEAQGQLDLVGEMKMSGSAFEEFAIQQDSIEFKTQALKNAWSEFINTASGGKDVVKDVMDALIKGVEKLTDLAGNPIINTLMKGAVGALGAGAIMTSTNAVWKMMSMGVTQVLGPLTKANFLTKGLAETFSGMTKVAGVGKMGGVIKGLTGIGGAALKAVPYLGGVLLVLEALKLFDIDVLGGIAKALGFEDAGKKVDEFKSKSDELRESLSENVIFNGKIEGAQDTIDEMQTIIDKKLELDKEDGSDILRNLSFSHEEFESIQAQYNGLIDNLGLDEELKITWNNFDEIKDKIAEIQAAKDELLNGSVKELIGDMRDAAEVPQDAIETIVRNNGGDYRKAIETQEFKDLEENYRTNIEYYKQAQEQLQRNLGNLDAEATREAFMELNSTKAREAMLTEIAREVSTRTAAKKDRDGLQKQLEDSLDYWGDWSGVSEERKQDFVIQSKEMLDYINSLGGEFENLGAEIFAWGREGAHHDDEDSGYQISKRLMEAIKEDVKNFDGAIEDYEKLFNELGTEVMGLEKDTLEKIKSQAEAGGMDLVDALFNYGEFGQAALGMGLNWNALAADKGIDVGDLARNVQNQVDNLDLSAEAKMELGITVDEGGTVNFEALETVLGLDEELISHFRLVDESGPNVENIMSFLDEIESNPEILASVGLEVDENGQLGLDRFLDFWGSLGEEEQKDFVATVTTELDEAEVPEVMTIFGEIEVGEIPQGTTILEVPAEVDTSEAEAAILGLQNLLNTYNLSVDMGEPNMETWNQITDIVNSLNEQGVEVELKVINPQTGHLEPIELSGEVKDIDVSDAGAPSVPVQIDFQGGQGGGLNSIVEKEVAGVSAKVPITYENFGSTIQTPESQTHVIDIQANNENAEIKIANTLTSLMTLTGTPADVPIDGDDTGFRTAVSSVSMAAMPLKTVNIVANTRDFYAALSEIKAAAGSVTVSIKGAKSSSQAIVMSPQLGTSFSTSVGEALTSAQQQNQQGRSSSKANEPAKVNEDVWRYWAKELFTGLPLERAMESLEREIKKADKNQDKLIDLYRKQIDATNKQIAYQTELQAAQRKEAQDIIGKLAKYGFQSNGLQITNLDRAKSLSGDEASEADKLLSEWKKIYESISGIDKKIADLNLDKYELEDEVRNAKIAKELERVERAIKDSEALLLSIEQNTDIQSKREEMVNDSDYELQLAIKEQGLNTSTSNIKALIDEFNRLSQTGVEFEENAEEMQDQLDNLKDSILDNADAVLEYREALNEIRIERMTNDYDKFITSLNSNLDKLMINIDTVREGMLSGTSMSDLSSSQFSTFDFTRRTQLEREQELRLQLEADLNKAMDDYARINIDRTAKTSEAVLKIEQNKYNQMLKMANDYTNGEAISISAISKDYDIGFTEVVSKALGQQYTQWQNHLKGISDTYAQEYTRLMKSYDDMSKTMLSSSERYMLNNNFVLDQLKLQEKMYREIVKVNNQAIDLAKEELKNTSLTTEQREALLDAIREYEEANVDAQTSIRDSVTSRFDVEFGMLDKMMGNVAKYTSDLEYMLEVAELLGTSADNKKGLFDSLFASKVNQYTDAKKQLEQLIEQQSKFTEYSLEWNLLNDKIEEVRESIKSFGKDSLNANKNLLDNMLEDIRETFETGLLKGKTLDEWKDYTDQWISGLTKEIELDNIRQRLIDNENELIKRRLEALDRQEEVSQKDVEYLDKQLAIIELENKLNNIGQERDVQLITRRDDGTFGLDYTYNQSEYDKTQKELDDARKELEKFNQELRGDYVSDLGSIIDGVESGRFSSVEDLQKALANLNAVYGFALSDIPDLSNVSYEELVAAYQQYLSTNALLGNELLGQGEVGDTSGILNNIGAQFESSFLNVSEQLGEIIGNELRLALGLNDKQSLGDVYHIESLTFPNVTDTTGFQQVLETLDQSARQFVGKK